MIATRTHIYEVANNEPSNIANAKLASNANLARATGAVYNFISGNLANSQIQVTAGVTKVSQRYQTVIAIKNELGTLPLETLTTTSSWEALKPSGNSYKITGLEPKSLDHADVNRKTLRNAVQKATRRHRISRRPRVGLVLGAGGVLGAAWMAGALVALQERLDR